MPGTKYLVFATLILTTTSASAVDLKKLTDIKAMADKPLLENVNKSLAEQQVKDGQFEFKTGKAEFAPGNDKRVKGLLKILTENSKPLTQAFPNLTVIAEGHTDADGKPEANEKLSLARAAKVCAALKKQGMKMPCKATGVGSAKPLVTPENTPADKQRNRRVLVQVAQ
jgi:outer membrane protein OmpA-like peptidoglycan-associated protein